MSEVGSGPALVAPSQRWFLRFQAVAGGARITDALNPASKPIGSGQRWPVVRQCRVARFTLTDETWSIVKPSVRRETPLKPRPVFRQSDGGQRRLCNGGLSFSITGPLGRLSTTRCLPVSLALDMVARFRFRLRIRRSRSLPRELPRARDIKMPLRAHSPRSDTH
jgi:hypothetical protein